MGVNGFEKYLIPVYGNIYYHKGFDKFYILLDFSYYEIKNKREVKYLRKRLSAVKKS